MNTNIAVNTFDDHEIFDPTFLDSIGPNFFNTENSHNIPSAPWPEEASLVVTPTKRRRVNIPFREKIKHVRWDEQGNVKIGPFGSEKISPKCMELLNKGRYYYLGLYHYRNLVASRRRYTTKHPRLEQLLSTFFHAAMSNSFPIYNLYIREAAKLLADQIMKSTNIPAVERKNYEGLLAFPCWAKNVAKRNALQIGDTEIPKPGLKDLHAAKDEVQGALRQYELNCIFVLEKLPLFYDVLPTDVRAIKVQPLKSGELPQTLPAPPKHEQKLHNRIMLIMATNAVGLKIPIAMVGNQSDPGCFGLRESPLPYIYQENGWVDEDVLNIWFQTVFVTALADFTSKVVLLVDTTWVPLDLTDGYDQIDLIGIPAYDVSGLHPMTPIISSIQMKYRLVILDIIVGIMTNNATNTGTNILDSLHDLTDQRISKGSPPDLVDTAHYLNYAWNTMPVNFIARCWNISTILHPQFNAVLSTLQENLTVTKAFDLFVTSFQLNQINLIHNMENYHTMKIMMESDVHSPTYERCMVQDKLKDVQQLDVKTWVKFERSVQSEQVMNAEWKLILNRFLQATQISFSKTEVEEPQTTNPTLATEEQPNEIIHSNIPQLNTSSPLAQVSPIHLNNIQGENALNNGYGNVWILPRVENLDEEFNEAMDGYSSKR